MKFAIAIFRFSFRSQTPVWSSMSSGAFYSFYIGSRTFEFRGITFLCFLLRRNYFCAQQTRGISASIGSRSFAFVPTYSMIFAFGRIRVYTKTRSNSITYLKKICGKSSGFFPCWSMKTGFISRRRCSSAATISDINRRFRIFVCLNR